MSEEELASRHVATVRSDLEVTKELLSFLEGWDARWEEVDKLRAEITELKLNEHDEE